MASRGVKALQRERECKGPSVKDHRKHIIGKRAASEHAARGVPVAQLRALPRGIQRFPPEAREWAHALGRRGTKTGGGETQSRAAAVDHLHLLRGSSR
jgi:hypothetical protein